VPNVANRVWYVDANRTAINWGTAVSGGRATQPIYKIVAYDDLPTPVVRTTLWTRPGALVSAPAVAAAQAETSGTAIPTDVSTTEIRTGNVYLRPVRPQDYGAVGDGIADDTTAIQAAINACAPSTNPVTTIREATRVFYLPNGTYKVTAPLNITSVQGFHMMGDGFGSLLRPSGTFTNVLNINGAARSIFEDFRVEGTITTGRVDACIDYYYASAGAARTSSGCVFRNIWIGGNGTRFIHGFGVSRISTGTAQVDNSVFDNVVVTGFGKADATLWQNAWTFGNGAQGNQTDYFLRSCSGVSCKTIYDVTTVRNCYISGGSTGAAQRLVYLNGPSGSISFSDINCEAIERLIDGIGASSSPVGVSFRNIQFDCNALPVDGEWIRYARVGMLLLANVTQRNWPAVNPPATTKMVFTPAVASLTVLLDGIGVLEPLNTMFTVSGPVVIHARGLAELVRGTNLVSTRYPHLTIGSDSGVPAVMNVRSYGDTYDRVQIYSDGQIMAGSGAVAPTGKTWAGAAAIAADRVDAGEIIPVRDLIVSSGIFVTSGEMTMSCFTAEKTETITTLTCWTGSTAAAATPTLCRLGIYSLAANGDGTLIASTPNDTTLFSATNATYTRTLSVPWSKVRGQRYAFALLVVTTVATPTFHGQAFPATAVSATINGVMPRLVSRLSGQTDLPASFVNGALSGKQYRVAVQLS
jgi:Pectate lyase superfamily protein